MAETRSFLCNNGRNFVCFNIKKAGENTFSCLLYSQYPCLSIVKEVVKIIIQVQGRT